MCAVDTCPEIASDEDRPGGCLDEAGGRWETLHLLSAYFSPVAEDTELQWQAGAARPARRFPEPTAPWLHLYD